MKNSPIWSVLLVLAALTVSYGKEPDTTGPPRKVIPPAPPAEKEAPPKAEKHIALDLGGGVTMKLVLISAGEFTMGSPESEKDDDSDESPAHRVRITRPFHLGVTEVTQEQYERVMGVNPSNFRGPTLPVECVSWNDAVAFCRKLSEKEGKVYRLPTEAEWEYACRAGATTLYGFGVDPSSLGKYAWYNDNSGRKTHPVGRKKPNAWGLHDMHGNVWEWCADWYDSDYYAISPTDNPTGPTSGSYRLVRGGIWNTYAGNCRSAYRYNGLPSSLYFIFGFRVACSLEPPAFKEVKIESLPKGWGYAHKTLTADRTIRGGHLSGGPDAPRVYESEEQCKAADMKLISGLVADVLEASKKKKPEKEEPPAMDRTKHGYKRVSINYGDGTTLTFVAKFTDEFKEAKVQAIHKAIAKYGAGAW